jgi:uncharacterized DUF497 family protein
MSLQFEWDAGKTKSNEARQGVSFEQATAVFADRIQRVSDARLSLATQAGETLFSRAL